MAGLWLSSVTVAGLTPRATFGNAIRLGLFCSFICRSIWAQSRQARPFAKPAGVRRATRVIEPNTLGSQSQELQSPQILSDENFFNSWKLRADLDYSRVDHSLRSACIGSVLAALRAGITAATSAADPRSTVVPANSNGFHGATPKSWLAMRYPAPIAAGMPI